MKKLTFTLDNAERSCKPGFDYAATLFKPGKPYTLNDLIRAGLSATSIAWLLFERARLDASTVPIIQAWARNLVRLQKVRGQKFDTPDGCMEAVRASMRAWAKKRPTGKGARAWAEQELITLILLEDF